MAIILKKLHVDCYRGINQLDLEDFNHVNILVGDNNAGKTSVMEMICTLPNPLSVSVWNEIARKKSSGNKGINYYNAYNNIFPIDKEKKVQFDAEFAGFDKLSVCITAEIYKTTIAEREQNRINGFIRTGKHDVEDAYVDANVMEIKIKEADNTIEFEIYDFQRKPPRISAPQVNLESVKKSHIRTAVFLEPRDGLENDFSYIKNAILDTEYYEQLIEILKEFDPAITDIFAMEEMGNIVYYVRTTDHSSAVPISVYGDGLKKTLAIFAALASSKNGIMLIDEVETSIHTSAMKTVFNMLVRWTRKLNIQLFVSTHSKEALDTLLTCDDEYASGINVYTLYHNEQKNYVRKLSCEKALELQNRMGMEIR